jgi:Zn-dependent protease with chaperone function
MHKISKSILLLSAITLLGGCASSNKAIQDSLALDGKAQFIGVDHTCQNMYESYDANLESAMSIGMILASHKVSSFTSKFSSSSSQNAPTESEIKKLAREIAKKSFWVPLSFEKLYAEQIIEQRLKDGKLISKNTKNKKYIKMYKKLDLFIKEYIDYTLKDNKKFPFEIDIYITTEKDSAESIPYGKIIISESFVTNGRYKTILAHELTHISKRHTSKEMQFRVISIADSFTDILQIVNNVQSNDKTKAGQFLAAMNIQGKFEKYSQDMELEADACGVKLLGNLYPKSKAKYVNEMILNIDRTIQDEKAQEYTLQEHPDKESRINNIKEIAKSL